MTKEELLKVLDMSEDEQWGWLIYNRAKYGYVLFQDCLSGNSKRMAIADLAFRLRDEAIMLKEFPFLMARVYNHAHGYKPNKGEIHAPIMMMWIWFAGYAKPIHWVIASLIAKETK